MSESKTIKGQVWIQHISDYPRKDSLVQEQLLVIPKQDITTNTVTLIENIWDDLKSEGTYKWNGKKYFYWEYKMTYTENEDVEVAVKFECPRPYNDFFSEEDTEETVIGDYAKYWIKRYKTAEENFEYKESIQKKDIIFPPTQYVNSNGELVEVDEIKVSNNDIGDITNLLNLF